MFLAGLEIDMGDLQEVPLRERLCLGLLGFALPLGVWRAPGVNIYGFAIAAAMLVGSICASHTLVTLPEVREAGLGHEPSRHHNRRRYGHHRHAFARRACAGHGRRGLAGRGPRQGGLGLLAITVYSVLVLPWVGKRFFRGTGQDEPCASPSCCSRWPRPACIAEAFGIEGLVGAFLAGLGVNGSFPRADR